MKWLKLRQTRRSVANADTDGQTDIANATFEKQDVCNQSYLQFPCRSSMLELLELRSRLENCNLELELCSWWFGELCSFSELHSCLELKICNPELRSWIVNGRRVLHRSLSVRRSQLSCCDKPSCQLSLGHP